MVGLRQRLRGDALPFGRCRLTRRSGELVERGREGLLPAAGVRCEIGVLVVLRQLIGEQLLLVLDDPHGPRYEDAGSRSSGTSRPGRERSRHSSGRGRGRCAANPSLQRLDVQDLAAAVVVLVAHAAERVVLLFFLRLLLLDNRKMHSSPLLLLGEALVGQRQVGVQGGEQRRSGRFFFLGLGVIAAEERTGRSLRPNRGYERQRAARETGGRCRCNRLRGALQWSELGIEQRLRGGGPGRRRPRASRAARRSSMAAQACQIGRRRRPVAQGRARNGSRGWCLARPEVHGRPARFRGLTFGQRRTFASNAKLMEKVLELRRIGFVELVEQAQVSAHVR
jgi:hypothetical protein